MIQEQLYEKLSRVIPEMESRLASGIRYGTSVSEGYMDLTYDYLGKTEDGAHLIALGHHYEMNGDLVPDPDMQIRVDINKKTAEAMTFQNLYVYQEVSFDEPVSNAHNERLKKELNLFLSQWLNNAIAQGHRIDFSKAERERTEEMRGIENTPEYGRRKDGTSPEQGIER